MTKLKHKRVDIKAILTNPVLCKEIMDGAVDFICKVEGIRSCLKTTETTEQ